MGRWEKKVKLGLGGQEWGEKGVGQNGKIIVPSVDIYCTHQLIFLFASL
jgi:hypothetical protein